MRANPPKFKAYAENIQAKWGKSPEDFWRLAVKKGYMRMGKMNAVHADLLKWLKSDIDLGHVYANSIIAYLRARAKDPTQTPNSRKWIKATWKV
jgi:hypothetical protein